MDNAGLLSILAISLGLTIIFEVGFYLITGKQNSKDHGISGIHKEGFFKVKWNKKDLLLVILVNTLTNPVVVLLYLTAYYYTSWNTTAVKIPLELFAILTEGYIFKRYAQSIKKPFLFSLAANMFSFTLGVIIQQII